MTRFVCIYGHLKVDLSGNTHQYHRCITHGTNAISIFTRATHRALQSTHMAFNNNDISQSVAASLPCCHGATCCPCGSDASHWAGSPGGPTFYFFGYVSHEAKVDHKPKSPQNHNHKIIVVFDGWFLNLTGGSAAFLRSRLPIFLDIGQC